MKMIFFQPLFYYVLGLILANLVVIAAPVGEVDLRAYNEEYTLAERSIDGELIEARSEEWEPLYARETIEVDDLLFAREAEFDSVYERDFEGADLEERNFFKKIFGGIKKVAKMGAGMIGLRSEEGGIAGRSTDTVEQRSIFGKIFGGIKKVAKTGAGMLGFRSEEGGIAGRSTDAVEQRSIFGKIFKGVKKVAKVGAEVGGGMVGL